VIPHVEMLYMLKDADLSVNPTSGEGFGLIPLEHMATGLPVIVSNNTGCKEYINPEFNISIKCHKVQAYHTAYEQFGIDERPDYEEMKGKIYDCYKYREDMKKIGKKASEWVHKNWTWDHSADKLLEVIKNVRGSLD